MKHKRILYILHVSWFWIKQRPQYLAEEISKTIPITVACIEDPNQKNKLKQIQVEGNLVLKSFFSLATNLNSSFTAYLNYKIKKIQLVQLIKQHYFIWIISPAHFSYLKNNIKKKHFLIYDCMDNAVEFYSDNKTRKIISDLERELCDRANLIIVSSKVLEENLKKKYGENIKASVVNNGLNFRTDKSFTLPTNLSTIFFDKTKKFIVYIGTISSWFSFSDVIPSLEKFENLNLILIGPKDCEIPEHSQIIHAGVVKHELVNSIMYHSDALIMPFTISDLILAVNPVKAYEYISSGKPVILKRYPETFVFENFAYLYEEQIELTHLFSKIAESNLEAKKNFDECLVFAKENTWENRANNIIDLINAHKELNHKLQNG